MTDLVSVSIVGLIIFLVFRWLSGPGDQNPNPNNNNNRRIPQQIRSRPVNPEMVETVRSMFPHLSTAAIVWDLQKTGSVEQTCDNVLRDGTLPMPPAPRPASPPTTTHTGGAGTGAGTGASSSNNVNGNLVQRFKLQAAAEQNFVPEEPTKVWETSAEKRQTVFQSRKEFMVLQARKRFLEEEAKRKQKEEQEASGSGSVAPAESSSSSSSSATATVSS